MSAQLSICRPYTRSFFPIDMQVRLLMPTTLKEQDRLFLEALDLYGSRVLSNPISSADRK